MSFHAFAAVSQLLSDDFPGCSVWLSQSAGHRREPENQTPSAPGSVRWHIDAQPMVRNAILARDVAERTAWYW
jgi:hypothetical protein